MNNEHGRVSDLAQNILPKEVAPGIGYEKIVAGIYRQFAGAAEVTEGERVRGRSGRLRQIDVALRTEIVGNPLLIVVECKHYGRRVGVEKVESLIGKMIDVGAARGVLVSDSGFTSGARSRAAEDGRVQLASVIDAQNGTLRSRVRLPVAVTIFKIGDQRFSLPADKILPDANDPALLHGLASDVTARFLQWYGQNATGLCDGDNSYTLPVAVGLGQTAYAECSFHMSVRHYVNENIYQSGVGIYDHLTRTVLGDEGMNRTVLDFGHIEAHWREASEAEVDSYQVAYRVSYIPANVLAS